MKTDRFQWTGTLAALLAVAATGAVVTGQDSTGAELSPVIEIAPGADIPTAVFTKQASRSIDLAICLDTSGSMKGLIDSARQKIWTIVSDLALAKPEPSLRVALVVYGGGSYPAEDGYVRVDAPLTTDLDLVSQKLFSLVAQGSTEYVGRVVDTSTRTLQWNTEPGSLKLMIVAGNESADQDKVVPFRDACARAIAKDIMIDSIYCGPESDNIAPLWREVARLADGHFASIDKDGTFVIPTPFDADLTRLSTAMTTTSIPYGAAGQGAWQNQREQDSNASGLNSDAAASRATLKGGKLYKNDHWDLVDASQCEGFVLADVKDDDLPKEMRKMSLEQKQAHIDKKRAERDKIQKEIAAFTLKRNAFLEEAMKLRDETKTFDFVVRKAIRDQAASRGFTFESNDAPAPQADAEKPEEAGAEVPPPAPKPPVPAQRRQGQSSGRRLW